MRPHKSSDRTSNRNFGQPVQQRLGDRAARVGFDWRSPAPVLKKIQEELGELESALEHDDLDAAADELGDVLFATVMLARKLERDTEAALERANRKFMRRFRWIEEHLATAGEAIADAGLERLEALWNEAKAAEG